MHQVEQREALRVVALGDGDDQAQVADDELALGVPAVLDHGLQLASSVRREVGSRGRENGLGLLTGLHSHPECDLVGLREQRVSADLAEVLAQEVFNDVALTACRHSTPVMR